MRDTKRFVSGKLGGLVTVTCPDCGGRFRVAQIKADSPAVCTFCNAMVECPAQHKYEPSLEKLKIPLKGTIVSHSGSVDLDTLEAESDAYTGNGGGFSASLNADPSAAVAEASAAAAASRRALTSGRKSTRKIRASAYRFVTIALVTLVLAGVGVFIWLMHTQIGKP